MGRLYLFFSRWLICLAALIIWDDIEPGEAGCGQFFRHTVRLFPTKDSTLRHCEGAAGDCGNLKPLQSGRLPRPQGGLAMTIAAVLRLVNEY